MEILRIIKEKKGQSLIEVTISFGLIVVVLGGLFPLFFGSIGLLLEAQNKTVAYNLAAEGIEVVRQNRNEGCALDSTKISASGTRDTNKTYVLTKDVTAGSNSIYLKPEDPLVHIYTADEFRLNFSGTKFQRRIYLYSIPPASPIYGQFGAGGAFDGADKFFIAEVEITWTGKLGSGTFKSTKTLVREWKNT